MNEWYCLHTKPNAETKVATLLERRDIKAYLPLVTDSTSARGREERPFFPCYLFARIDFLAVAPDTLRWTPGLRSIIGSDNGPATIPANLIEGVRHKVAAFNRGRGRADHGFSPGDPVIVTEGSLQGMVATFDDYRLSSSDRVQVLLSMLGRICRLQVDPASLELSAAHPVRSAKPARRGRRTRGRGRRC